MACSRISGPHRLFYCPFVTGSEFPTLNQATMYLGMTGEEGIRITKESMVEDIKTDRFGDTVVDGVYRGVSVELKFVLQEVNRDVVAALHNPFQTPALSAYDGTPAAEQETVGAVGKLVCGVLGTLWAYPEANTPAAAYWAGSAGDATDSTSDKAGRMFKGIAIGPIEETLDTSARFIPTQFRCYPFYDGSVGEKWKMWRWVDNITLTEGL